MSLKTERLILRGKLAELKQEKMRLATALDANVKAAKAPLAASMVTPLAELDLATAHANLSEALEQQRNYRELCAKIAELEQELA